MRKLYVFIVTLCAVTFFWSCSDISDEFIDRDVEQLTATLRFDITRNEFDGEGGTRATTNWTNGSVLYLRFQTANGYVTGKATYNSSIQEWTLSCDGSLTRDNSMSVIATYFEGDATANATGKLVSITPYTCAYRDTRGTYLYSSDTNIITINANLRPTTGRIRFKGTKNTSFWFSGVTTYSSYDVVNDNFSSVAEEMNLTVQSDGYTRYLYCRPTDSSRPQLRIRYNTKDYSDLFIANCPNTILQSGKSGWMNVPTSTNHNGWETQKTGSLGGHEFVDLGLPSGLLWATCNVGASKPEEYGDYFAWGETSTKSEYYDSNSITYGKTIDELKSAGIIGSDGNLTSAYDAASVNWGVKWRMPTLDELEELVYNNNTTTIWTTLNGVNGRLVTSKTNGNFIFLPAAGYYNSSNDLCGRYWTSSFHEIYSGIAYNLDIYPGYILKNGLGCYYGLSVRPISEP